MIKSHHFSAILPVSQAVYQWTDQDFLKLLKTLVQQVGLNTVGEMAIAFQPQGMSAVVLLEESHVALHFWPEESKVSVDIHVCDFQHNNYEKAEQLTHLLTLHLSSSDHCDDWHHLSLIR
ncbi:S-adenosylmethionine decarboxylase [Oscillatoria sp. FACHB-1407]|nr:S-adenosylmethionine decarboxylase [Oscillatoria sp. FACHB-1407]